ncbi:hypothetical protein MJ579_14100 [Klebsiella pneumoniae]|nr:hypothetical protein MJ579_14100 [Klebsiella pneumoniae]
MLELAPRERRFVYFLLFHCFYCFIMSAYFVFRCSWRTLTI